MRPTVLLFMGLLLILLSARVAMGQGTHSSVPSSEALARTPPSFSEITSLIGNVNEVIKRFEGDIARNFTPKGRQNPKPPFTKELFDQILHQLQATSESFTSIKKDCASHWCDDAEPQRAAYQQALQAYRSEVKALVGPAPDNLFDGYRYSTYKAALTTLKQCESNYLRALQQIQAENTLMRNVERAKQAVNAVDRSVTKVSKLVNQFETTLTNRMDTVKNSLVRSVGQTQLAITTQAATLHTEELSRLDTITKITRRTELHTIHIDTSMQAVRRFLQPYALPHGLLLAGIHQANAYSLGGVYYGEGHNRAAGVAARYDASNERWGLEAGLGFRAQSVGLLAGPTLQIGPAQLGWKMQVLLLKTGVSLGAAYDSRLGPGVVAAMGFH